MTTGIRLFFTLWLTLAACGMLKAQAGQRANFARFDVKSDLRHKGLHGIGVGVEIEFEKFGHQVSRPDTNSPRYWVLVRLIDSNESYVGGVPDAGHYQNLQGLVQDSVKLTLPNNSKQVAYQDFFLPYFALDLRPGPTRVLVEVQVLDALSREKVGFRRQMVEFEKPETKLFRLEVESLQALATDINGETWDYAFLSDKDAYPELFWKIVRGGREAFRSPRQKNTLVYRVDPEGEASGWLTVSRGDWLALGVYDFDRITFNDEIGWLYFDPFSGNWPRPESQDLVFDRVQRIRVLPDLREVPRIEVISLKKTELIQVDGLTGLALDLEFNLPQSQPGIRYFLETSQQLLGANVEPAPARIVSGPATLEADGRIELVSRKGAVRLFVPGHQLPVMTDPGDQSWVLLRAWGHLDEAAFRLWERKIEVKESYQQIPDLVWGQWTAEEAFQNDAYGMLLTCGYGLPAAYHADLPDSRLSLRADLHIGEASLGTTEVVEADLSAQPDPSSGLLKGKVQLFVPYHRMPAGHAAQTFRLDYESELSWENGRRPLGNYRIEQQLELPPIREVGIRVAEILVRKKVSPGSKPNLRWQVGVGNEVLYQSSMAWENYNPRWKAKAQARIALSDRDEVWVRVVHDKGVEGQVLLGEWRSPLSDLPENKRPQRVKLGEVKKLVISVEK